MKEIKEEKSRRYLQEVLKEIPAVINGNIEKNDKLETIPKTIAITPKPSKAEVSANRLSRFKKDTA